MKKKLFSILFRLKKSLNIKIFIIAFIVSCLGWLSLKLSKHYEHSLKLNIEIVNIPESMMLAHTADTTISISIKSQGYVLIFNRKLNSFESLKLDFKEFNQNKYFTNNSLKIPISNIIQKIKNKFDIRNEIISISSDTIKFKFIQRYSKKIKIEPLVNYTLAKQFFIEDTIVLMPDSATIFGSEQEIQKIKNVYTEIKRYNNLNKTIVDNLNLQILDKGIGKIKIKPNRIQIIIPVEKFTEAKYNVQISDFIDEQGYKYKFFPDKCKISCLVGISKYNKITNEDFKVEILQQPQEKSNLVKLHITQKPPSIKIINIEPSECEYIKIK